MDDNKSYFENDKIYVEIVGMNLIGILTGLILGLWAFQL